jgi:hypothetical protein
MELFESSDRRTKWEATVEKGARVSQGYLLEESHTSLRLDEVEITGFGFYNCRFEGGHWLGVKLGKVDFSQVEFRHVYFEDLDFSECSFASTRFAGCTFTRCRYTENPEWIDGLSREGCHTAAEPPMPAAVTPASSRLAVPSAVPSAAPAPTVAAPLDRFARLER